MDKPLFILQAVCKDRQMCRECRDPQSSVYRDGWAARYQMPPEWPNCPFGRMAGYEGHPKPVPPSLLGITVDQPDSTEAKAVMDRVNARADFVRPICLNCPGKYFNKLHKNGLTVDCEKGYRCCGGGLTQGNVYLGTGNCQMGYWDKA